MQKLWRRILSSSVKASFGAAGLAAGVSCVAPAARAEVWPPASTTAAADGWTAKPMRLGLRAESWRDSGEEIAPKAARPPSQCRKWQLMALQLGETFAGYTLRHTVLQRLCGDLGDTRLEESWDWPWSGFTNGRMTPPRMVRSIEAWDIRCGKAGARQRCAMLHADPDPADAPVSQNPAVVTHFVIDMVAGRESVLWRVFVGAEAAAKVSAGEPVTARASKRSIRYSLGHGDYVERFSKCEATGCIMEANLLHGGEVATRLWDGRDVALFITLASGRVVELSLPARGFRAGMAELVRLRRDELRSARR